MRGWNIALAAGLVLTCGESTEPGPPPRVATALVVEESIPLSHEFEGATLPYERVELRAAVEGQLLSVEVVDGSKVRAGDILFVIESEAYETAVARAGRELQQSEASLASARANLALLQERFEAGEMSRENYEREEAEVEQSRVQAEARGDALTRAQSALASTRLTAPLSGRVQLGASEVGSSVGSDSGVLATITRLHPMRARFMVDRPEVLDDTEHGTAPRGKHDPPATLELRLSDGTLYPFAGRIESTEDAGSGNVEVLALFPNTEGTLLADQPVNITLLVPGSARPRLLVPTSAIHSGWRGSFALIVDAENRIERRRIETGALIRSRQIVEHGLTAGEQVVLEAEEGIHPGMEVNPGASES